MTDLSSVILKLKGNVITLATLYTPKEDEPSFS